MKKLFLVLVALFCPALLFAQNGVYVNGLTLSPSGRPVSANIAVCTSPGLVTTAAQVIGNTAIITFGSSPITAGFAANMQLVVSGFTGGDTYFNSGTLVPFVSTVTITAVSSTTITFPLVHVNASASSNGFAFQQGNISTPCAPLASIYNDAAEASPITQPGFLSSGIGNWNFAVSPGSYMIQFYGTGITTYLQPISPTAVSVSANNAFTGNNTHSGTETFTNTVGIINPGVFTNTQMNLYNQTLINSAVPQTFWQAGFPASFTTDALTAAILIPASSTVFQSNTLAAYSQGSSTTTNSVALFSMSFAGANNVRHWSLNTVVSDRDISGSTKTGVTATGYELDVNCNNVGSICQGVVVQGGSTVSPTVSNGFRVASIGAGQKWANGFITDDGSTNNGLILGAQGSTSASSQALFLSGRDAGGVQRSALIQTNLNGQLNITPAAGQPVVVAGALQTSTSLVINGAAALTTSGQTGSGNIVLQGSPAITTPTLTSPVISTGVSNNGSGFKHIRFAGNLGGTCPTAAAIGAPCTSGNINWATAFADNNYTVSCTLNGAMTAQPHIVSTSYQAAGAGITITIAADTAVAANVAPTGFTDCIAVHD